MANVFPGTGVAHRRSALRDASPFLRLTGERIWKQYEGQVVHNKCMRVHEWGRS